MRNLPIQNLPNTEVTVRRKEVKRLNKEGLTNRQISTELNIEERRVRDDLSYLGLHANISKIVVDEKSNDFNLLKQLLIGSMLGDGYLTKNEKITYNSRLSIAHIASKKEYLQWKSDTLSKFNLNGKIAYNRIYNQRYKNGFIEEYRFKSKANNLFTKWRNIFYPYGKKVLNFDYIQEIDAIGLSIWFMDDGYLHVTGAMYLSTNGFTLVEVNKLRNLLLERFNISTNLHFSNGKPLIHIPTKESEKFVSLINPYLVNCMKYKVLNKLDKLLETPSGQSAAKH